MTPSLARIIMGMKPALPIKWFSIPQCWRYERMTRGRRREHYQWNVDVWGVQGVEAEVEVISVMVRFFTSVGITQSDVGIKVNSRGIIGALLEGLGIPEDKFAETCVLIDKLEKVPVEALKADLEELGITEEQITALTDVLVHKDIEKISEVVGSDCPAVQDVRKLFSMCTDLGIVDWLEFDASVIRGLSYYTGIVFEAFDRSGTLRAIAGGGRYDKLLESFGGDPTPAVGFGFGDAVIVELLKDKNLLPDFEKGEVEFCVYSMDEGGTAKAMKVANELREKGCSVDVVLEEKKMKWAFKHADRIGAKRVVIVGGDEGSRGEVRVKNMESGEQETVKVAEIGEWAENI
ncbi:hypothetical protein TrST_g12678 [Triparma strigata]|nr:hypothetical protein TrST_g12678 [Triparma strigata]